MVKTFVIFKSCGVNSKIFHTSFVLIRLEQNQGSTQDSVSTWRRTRCQIAGLGVEVVFSEKGLEDSRRVLEALLSVGPRSNSEAAKVGTIVF